MRPLRPLAAVLAGTFLVGACAQPEPVASDVPLPELAATAEPEDVAAPTGTPTPDVTGDPPGVAPSLEPTPEPTGTDVEPSPAPGDPTPDEGAGTHGDDGADPGDAAASPREIAAAADRVGDAGLEGPRWADLTALRLVDTGPDLAIAVTLAASVPDTLERGEVVGIGVDLFARGAEESSYQLFVDGGSDGWRAYLQTPEGFVAYPGTFRIVGARLELSVPWPAVGGSSEGEVSAFLDWSRRATITNLVARDDLPDRGRVAFAR